MSPLATYVTGAMSSTHIETNPEISLLDDMFAILAMSGAITSIVEFGMVVGLKSTGDNLHSSSSEDGSCR